MLVLVMVTGYIRAQTVIATLINYVKYLV